MIPVRMAMLLGLVTRLGAGEPATASATPASGSGDLSGPKTVTEAPLKALGLTVGLTSARVVRLTLEGPAGSLARVESAASLTGPWRTWTNVTVDTEGVELVDLSPGSGNRFYRAMAVEVPLGPAGFVWMAPGTFVMGSPTSEAGRGPHETQHTVTLTQGFWMSDHEVTQEEYEAMMGVNPSAFRGANLPVESVSWDDAVAYCRKLTLRDQGAGRITDGQAYRLPTEAEWEYAARAGTTGARYGELDAIAWYGINSDNSTHEVRQKTPNAWGLYDMLGNVWEWCSDGHGEYPTSSVTDPKGLSGDNMRVYRGGCYDYDAWALRAANRSAGDPGGWNVRVSARHSNRPIWSNLATASWIGRPSSRNFAA